MEILGGPSEPIFTPAELEALTKANLARAKALRGDLEQIFGPTPEPPPELRVLRGEKGDA